MSLLNWSTLNGKSVGAFFNNTVGPVQSNISHPSKPCHPAHTQTNIFTIATVRERERPDLWFALDHEQSTETVPPCTPSTKHHQSLNVADIRGEQTNISNSIGIW